MRSTHRRRRSVALVLVSALTFAPATSVTAQTPTETTLSDDALAAVIMLVLEQLDLPPAAADDVVDRVADGVSDRLDELAAQGIVDPSAVDDLAESTQGAGFDEAVAVLVAQTRARRNAFRSATEDILASFGIDVPEQGPLEEAIAQAGLSRADLADLLESSGVALPEPPTRPVDDECGPTAGEDCVPGGTERSAPTTTTPPAPTTTTPPAPTTTAPSAPEPPDYPSRGGTEIAPTPQPDPGYPSTGEDAPTANPEESL